MADTVISFRGEDRGAQTLLDRLRQKAEDLSLSVLRGAAEEGRALKDVTKSMEEQLKALERRKQIEFGVKRTAAERYKEERVANAANLGEVGAAERQYESKMGRIAKEETDFKLQTKLLRDILDAIKESARKEIAADRENVQAQINAYERGELSDLSDTEEFKLQYQRQLMKQRGDGGGGTAGGGSSFKDVFLGAFTGTALAQGFRNIASHVSNVLQQPNEFYMMASSIPFVGSLITRSMAEAEGYQQGLGGLSQMYGGNFRRFEPWIKNFSRTGAPGQLSFTQMGYAYPQIFEDINAAARAYGEVNERNAAGLMVGKQAFGFQEADLLEAMRMQRGGTEDVFGMMGMAVAGGRKAGVFQGSNLALLPEYFKILNETNRQQLEALGEISEGVNVGVVSALAGLDKAFQNPEILAKLVPAVAQGLKTASTPQVEALQYASLARLTPGASLWQMEEMKSAPLSAIDPITKKSYLETYLQTLFQASPGREEFYWNVKGTFGLEPVMARKLAEGYLSGGLDVNSWTQDIEKSRMDEGTMTQRAIDATGELAQETAELASLFAEKGDQVVTLMKPLIPALEVIGQGLSNVLDWIARNFGSGNQSGASPWTP